MTPVTFDTNLIPRELRVRRVMRRRLRMWTRVGGSYLAAVALASAAVLIVIGGRSTSALSELKDLNEQSVEFRSQLSKVEPQLKVLRQKLESRKVLAEQPDAGQLLALFAECLDEEIVLRQVSVNANGIGGSAEPPMPTFGVVKPVAAVAGAEREPRHFDVTIRGVSSTEKGVARLSDRLKALELFDEVELKRTTGDSMSATAVAFEVFCALREADTVKGAEK